MTKAIASAILLTAFGIAAIMGTIALCVGLVAWFFYMLEAFGF